MLELHPEDRNSNKGGVSPLLLFKLSFCLFLYPLSAPFLNPLSSPFPHFPCLSTIPSCFLINCLS